VDEAKSLLVAHRTDLDDLAGLLCEHETVDGSQIDGILGRTETPGELDETLHQEGDGEKMSPDEEESPVIEGVFAQTLGLKLGGC